MPLCHLYYIIQKTLYYSHKKGTVSSAKIYHNKWNAKYKNVEQYNLQIDINFVQDNARVE